MGRIGRSMQLVGQSYRILMRDKELMVLPLISGIFILGVAASFFMATGLSAGRFDRNDPMTLASTFVAYVLVYAIGIFFQAAVVAGATERMRGGDPTVRSSLQAAWSRVGAIVAWAVVAATVGMLLRAIQDRAGFIGRLIVSLVGAAWSLATFFMVPVLVFEDVSLPDAFSKSVNAFKTTWGESIAGSFSIGAAAIVGWFSLVAVAGLLAWAGAAGLALLVFFAGAAVLVTLTSALQGVYLASLYRFATSGDAPNGFDRAMLEQAFVDRSRRR